MNTRPVHSCLSLTPTSRLRLGTARLTSARGRTREVRYRPAGRRRTIENLSDKNYESVIVDCQARERRLKQTKRILLGSDQALQPTAGRSDVQLSYDFNIEIRSEARSRQRWLGLFSLDVEGIHRSVGLRMTVLGQVLRSSYHR